MTRDEAKEVAREAAREAVHELLIELGIDHKDPLEMQRDFQFLRDLRGGTEAVKRKSVLTLVGLLITALVAALVLGIRQSFLPGT